MREERRWFLMMSLIYAAVFTFCLYKNMSGITFPVIAAVSLGFSVMFLQKAGIRFQKGTIRYFAGILLLGTATVLTDSIFFHFFNCVGILLLYMMSMAHQIYKDQEWGEEQIGLGVPLPQLLGHSSLRSAAKPRDLGIFSG